MATRKLTKDEWVSTIAQWRRSGQTREVFCARRELNPRRMEFWERRLGGKIEAEEEHGAPAFVEVTADGEVVSAERLELEVRGIRIRLPATFDERALSRVLALLEARP